MTDVANGSSRWFPTAERLSTTDVVDLTQRHAPREIAPDGQDIEAPASGAVAAAAVVEGGGRLAENELVLLIAPGDKRYLIKLRSGAKLHTHLGIFAHDDLIGCGYGTVVHSQLEHPALVLEPGLRDLMTHLKRGTQIIYPKDAAYITLRLNLRSGMRVVEAGTGSGSLTMALAWAVAPGGRVFTYEAREETATLAQANLQRAQLAEFVTFHQQSIADGFLENNVDALFLDVREPWRFLPQASAALRPGGYFAGLVPTTNQVSGLVEGLERNGFVEVNVEELLLRTYKVVPDRLRPNDTMIGHTGYLIFARSTQIQEAGVQWQSKEQRRFLARRKMEERDAALAEENDAKAGGKYPRLPLPG